MSGNLDAKTNTSPSPSPSPSSSSSSSSGTGTGTGTAGPRSLRIGIVGASGMVGQSVVRHLREAGVGRLRLGARRTEGLQVVAAHDDELLALDLTDGPSLRAFCADCEVVVNAAGPSRVVRDRIAWAAVEAGADYVDAAGDELVHQLLAGMAHGGRRLLLSAGMMPGLSALLPRWLAGGEAGPLRLQAHIGGRDRFTRAAAGDYVDSLRNGYGTPLAAWRGRVTPRALTARQDEELPFFPGRVTALPYLSQENQRVAGQLRLAAGDWFNVFAGSHLRDAFARVQNLLETEGAPAAIDALCAAAALDLAGQAPYQLMVYQLDARERNRRLVLRGIDSYALSGAMAACATLSLLDGDLPAGVHFAGEAMPPDRTVARLRGGAAVTAFELVEGAVAVDEPAFEQGAL